MSELELRHLRVFVAAADAGAFTRAARILGLSQSTVSETLASLERVVGVPLFRRGTPGVGLTAAGEALLPRARQLLERAGALVAELGLVASGVNARLRIAAVESVVSYLLPARLEELRGRWPNARVEVSAGACVDIRAGVTAGKYDLGLVVELASAPAEGAHLATVRLAMVVAPGHPHADRAVSATELRRTSFYLSDAAGTYNDMLAAHFVAAGLRAPQVQALGTIEGVKRAVLQGAGVGLLPDYAVAGELAEGVLREVALQPALPVLALRAVVGAHAPLAEEMLAALAHLAGEKPAKQSA